MMFNRKKYNLFLVEEGENCENKMSKSETTNVVDEIASREI